jgi:DNA repair protein RecO (recombination protein O)
MIESDTLSATTRVNAPIALAGERPHQQDTEPGYVLHAYAFKETSLVVELFTRNFGRMGLVAKGARRPASPLRGTLMAFQPLLLAWSGKSELKVLHRAEWQGGHAQLAGLPLICGFYLNELLLKLMARDDPHPGLYGHYEAALATLREGDPPATVLRRFERRMLAELGYGLVLTHDVHGEPLQTDATYFYSLERGPVDADEGSPAPDSPELTGKALLDMDRDDYADAATLQQARALMRYVVNHYLGGKPLHTRQLLREMQQL